MTTLAEIRAKLTQQETKQTNFPTDNTLFPFWNMDRGDTAVLRFLPDGDTKNDFFWVEKQMFKFPFPGVKGDPDSKPVTVQAPCMRMYGEKDPVLAEISPWYDDPELKKMAGTYWAKRSYIFQGFVVDNPLKEEQEPDNPIRKFIIGPQIFKIIKAALMDPELEDLPTDYTNGLDFRLNKSDSNQGEFASYTTSTWARRERSLTDQEMSAINEYGLFNLSDSIPNKPSDEEQKIIFEMFKASLEEELYDPERWGAYFKPYGMQLNTSAPKSDDRTPEPTPKAESKAEADPKPAAKAEPQADDDSEPKSKANDILAMIRARQNNQ